MASIELKLTGAPELATKLREMPVKLERQALQDATIAAMQEALPDMREAVPQDEFERSPASQKYGTTRQNLRVVKITSPGRNSKGARIDTGNAFWQWYYNFGSRHQPARPWFAQRFMAIAQKVLDRFTADVGKAIEELWEEK
jgi:HK97 gp10 family phage protein